MLCFAHTESHCLGSKHWPKQKWDKLWTWTLERIDQIFVQVKPDTLSFWKSVFSVSVGVTPASKPFLITSILVSTGRQRSKEE